MRNLLNRLAGFVDWAGETVLFVLLELPILGLLWVGLRTWHAARGYCWPHCRESIRRPGQSGVVINMVCPKCGREAS